MDFSELHDYDAFPETRQKETHVERLCLGFHPHHDDWESENGLCQ